MARSLFSILPTVLSLGLVLLATGCGTDRYSGNTPYLGGVYGGAQEGPPRDTVSYWDGDSVNGSPSVKISLGEQRAYFYKGGVLVGVSQLSTGRGVISRLFKRIRTTSPAYSETMSIRQGTLWFQMSI